MKNYLQIISIVALMICIMCCFVSCEDLGIGYRNSLDEALHDQIELVWEDDNLSHIIYQGKRYNYIGLTSYCQVDRDRDNNFVSYTDDILLSWNGSRYFGYLDTFYSYSSDSPSYIYETRLKCVFLNEDYSCLKDTFLLNGTDLEFLLEDILVEKQSNEYFGGGKEVILSSKKYPRLRLIPDVICVNDQWCICLGSSLYDTKEVWTVSDDFIDALKKNGII